MSSGVIKTTLNTEPLLSLSLSLQVTVQVEDVNEPPFFPFTQYNASVVNVAAYKSTVIAVKVTIRETSSQDTVSLMRFLLSPVVTVTDIQ